MKRIILFSGLIIILIFLYLTAMLFKVEDRFSTQKKEIIIQANSSAKDIAEKLCQNGIISDPKEIIIVSKLLGYTHKLKAGRYCLSPSMTLLQILEIISRGATSSVQIKVTIPEGSSVYKIGEILKENKVLCGNTFYADLTRLKSFSNLGQKYYFLNQIHNYSLEGYLFPDTYLISPEINKYQLVNLMLARFAEIILPVWNNFPKGKYSLHEIITLASIIEKEAKIEAERSIISSVFHNRLQAGIALRADPTVKYALERPGKIVTLINLKVNSPYNTYLYAGLPPGPICNPGLDSFKAALYPAQTDYLYFVAQPDGRHIFSNTYSEHQAARVRAKKIIR